MKAAACSILSRRMRDVASEGTSEQRNADVLEEDVVTLKMDTLKSSPGSNAIYEQMCVAAGRGEKACGG